MAAIIGVDPSLSATGIAVWRDGKIYSSTIGTSPQPDIDGWGNTRRRARIAARIAGCVDTGERSTTLAVIEQAIGYRGHGRSDHEIVALRAVIVDRLAGLLVPVVSVAPSQVKAFAHTGRASKTDMIKAAATDLGITTSDDNQADALWLMAIGLAHAGIEMCEMTDKRRSVLRGIKWPPSYKH